MRESGFDRLEHRFRRNRRRAALSTLLGLDLLRQCPGDIHTGTARGHFPAQIPVHPFRLKDQDPLLLKTAQITVSDSRNLKQYIGSRSVHDASEPAGIG